MYLTGLDEKMLNGEMGHTLEVAMGILVALGDIYDADSLIPVQSTQIAGVSYKTIGDAGLEWISDMEGEVVVPSILNPAGMDLQCPELMGIGSDSKFAKKQREIVSAYEKLGIRTECTCTPYYLYEAIANYGDHLAWSESSAISYANSVIGARTNREGGPSALAAALVGKTPNYGYHLDENRVPTMVVKVEGKVSDTDFGALGHIVGKKVGNGIPLFIFEDSHGMVDVNANTNANTAPVRDGLKALGAAMAASGAVALYYVQDVTPDSRKYDGEMPSDQIAVTLDDIRAVRRVANILNKDGVVEEINDADADADIDIVAIGCPHCSVDELSRLSRLLSGKSVVMTTWIFTPRKIYNMHPELVSAIESSGAKVICDTCMVVSPGSSGFKRMLVNSGKAYNYVPSMCKIAASYASMEDCVKVAVGEKSKG